MLLLCRSNRNDTTSSVITARCFQKKISNILVPVNFNLRILDRTFSEPFKLAALTPVCGEADVATSIQELDIPKDLSLLSC